MKSSYLSKEKMKIVPILFCASLTFSYLCNQSGKDPYSELAKVVLRFCYGQ